MTVTVPNTGKDITGFALAGAMATTINTDTITVTLPPGTALTSLAPVITVSAGASVSPASGTSRDFSGPVTYTVTAENGDQKTYTVRVKASLESAAEVTAYLAVAPGGASPAAPIPLPVDIDLAGSGWTDLLSAISGAGKYVALVLPNAAERIKLGGGTGMAAFKGFTALERVSGANTTTVGDYAFYGCDALTTVDLPKAITIDEYAFRGCTALTTVGLPAATNIGTFAFRSCTVLTTMRLSASPPSLGSAVFRQTDTGTLTIKVPSGAKSVYTAADWVDAVANGNSGKYGTMHKAVVITDTP